MTSGAWASSVEFGINCRDSHEDVLFKVLIISGVTRQIKDFGPSDKQLSCNNPVNDKLVGIYLGANGATIDVVKTVKMDDAN